MVVPSILALILPLIAAPTANYLGKDHLPRLANALIAFAIALLAAICWGVVASTLTSDPIKDAELIATYCAVLVANPLAPLYKFMNFALFAKNTTPDPVVPGDPVAQRASTLAPGQTWTATPQPSTPVADKPTGPMPPVSSSSDPTTK